MNRALTPDLHGAFETVLGPAAVAGAFALGIGEAATVAACAFGVLAIAMALQVAGPRRVVPLSQHAGIDYLLAAFAVVAGVAIGLATGEWAGTSFLVGVGVVQALLTASTRFSAPLGA